MKFIMNLEIQEGVSLERVRQLLSQLGAEFDVCQQDEFSGSLPNDGAYFLFEPAGLFLEVGAERARLKWVVGVRGAFYCAPQVILEEMRSIRDFLLSLEKSIEQEFVLSFEFGEVYAIRDGGGLHRLVDQLI